MKRHTLSIIVALATPFLFLSGCKKEDLQVTPDSDPVTPTVTEEGKITLDKPIVLQVAVAPMRIVDTVDPSPGDLQNSYDQSSEIDKATVNTPDNRLDPSDFVVDRTPGNDKKTYADAARIRGIISKYDGGDDWIRSINIPELTRDSDYEVTGLVPWEATTGKSTDSNYKPAVPTSDQVTLTIYRLPKSKQITVFANSEVLYNSDGRGDKPTTGNEEYPQTYYADLDHPIIVASNNYLNLNTHYATLDNIMLPFLVQEKTAYDYDYFKKMFPRKQTLMESRNLPMYGRVTDLQVKKGKVYGKQFDQSEPTEVTTIYLERAVAKVEVSVDTPKEAFKGDYPEKFLWFDQIRPGTYMNFISFIPNNWKGLREAINKFGIRYKEKDGVPGDFATRWSDIKKFPYIRHGLQQSYGIQKDVSYLPAYADLEKGGKQISFFIPEARPATEDEQSTVRIALSSFKYASSAAEGSRLTLAVTPDKRHERRFDLLFGDKGPDGLFQIRRNTIYRLHLSLVNDKLELKSTSGARVLPWKIIEQHYDIDMDASTNKLDPIEK